MEPLESQIARAIRALCPEGMAAAAAPSAVAPQAHFPEELAMIAGAGEIRRSEFSAGRHCLREALALLGVQCGGIGRSAEGLPLVPEGYLGSISHSKGQCLAVAADAGALGGIGVDLECLGRISDAALARVLHPSEVTYVAANRDLASLLFSAKEAFYKMQFPKWGIRANFQDIAFKLTPVGDHWQMEATEWGACFPEALRRAPLRCVGTVAGSYVITLCWNERSGSGKPDTGK